jgi:RNA polymerase sigma-70 factor (ECF subfamily)
MASDADDQHRNRAYFESLYRNHYASILRFAARRTDPHAARDVTAETFLVAWRRLDSVPRSNELAWLYTTARNMLIHELRGQTRRSRLDQRVQSQPHEHESDPAEQTVQRLHAEELLNALPPKDREALQLTEWEHLDITTAARVAGCSAATFRVRLHRARRRLIAAAEQASAEPEIPTEPLLANEALS